MDPETREVLFGRSTKLGRRGWKPGATRVFFLEATAQAVVAEMTAEHTLIVRRDRTARAQSGVQCFEVDPTKFTFRGQPVHTLTDATRKLPALQKTEASSRVHARALALSEIFGTTYYLSESVAANLMPGDHFFTVGDEPVARRRYGADFSLDGQKLKWEVTGKQQFATLKSTPVYVMLGIGERLVAQKKAAKLGANPESCATASRGLKPTARRKAQPRR